MLEDNLSDEAKDCLGAGFEKSKDNPIELLKDSRELTCQQIVEELAARVPEPSVR